MTENKDKKSFGIESIIGGSSIDHTAKTEKETSKKKSITSKAKAIEKNEIMKMTTVILPEEKHKRLAILAITTGKLQKDLINEGIDLVLKKYGCV